MELDPEVEEAAASLGASRFTTLRRIILPALAPAITAGAALSFARGISEYGSLVLLSGNLPLKTEVAVGPHPDLHRERQRGGRRLGRRRSCWWSRSLAIVAARSSCSRWWPRRG